MPLQGLLEPFAMMDFLQEFLYNVFLLSPISSCFHIFQPSINECLDCQDLLPLHLGNVLKLALCPLDLTELKPDCSVIQHS